MDQATFDLINYHHYDSHKQQGVSSQQFSNNDIQLQSNSCYQVTNIGQTRELNETEDYYTVQDVGFTHTEDGSIQKAHNIK